MKYLIMALLVTGCTQPIDLSAWKREAKDSLSRHKVVCVTVDNAMTCTLEEKK